MARESPTTRDSAAADNGAAARARAAAEAVYRAESRRVFATLVRLLGDFDVAEEALHDAFRAALEQWPRDATHAFRTKYRRRNRCRRGSTACCARSTSCSTKATLP